MPTKCTATNSSVRHDAATRQHNLHHQRYVSVAAMFLCSAFTAVAALQLLCRWLRLLVLHTTCTTSPPVMVHAAMPTHYGFCFPHLCGADPLPSASRTCAVDRNLPESWIAVSCLHSTSCMQANLSPCPYATDMQPTPWSVTAPHEQYLLDIAAFLLPTNMHLTH